MATVWGRAPCTGLRSRIEAVEANDASNQISAPITSRCPVPAGTGAMSVAKLAKSSRTRCTSAGAEPAGPDSSGTSAVSDTATASTAATDR